MATAGRLAAGILDRIAPHVEPGVSTADLDARIQAMIEEAGATSATIGYKGYRHATCISVNHVVCHGIPSEKRLKPGDILNIDVTVIVGGWYGDTSRMFVAGPPGRKAERLIDITHDALMEGIKQVIPGNTFGDVGAAIQRFAEANRCSVVRDFCGHGLGRVFHSAPNVLHYGRWGTGPVLEPGMFFTIEPMINLGRAETRVLEDDWTAVTRDRSLSAQFEHSIGVNEGGCEIFTLSPAGRFRPDWSREG
jgi:methionyl aminopeptidase